MHCGMFSSIPVFYPLDASNTHILVTSKNVPRPTVEQNLPWLRTTALAHFFPSVRNGINFSFNRGLLVVFNKLYFDKEGVLNNYKILFLEEVLELFNSFYFICK